MEKQNFMKAVTFEDAATYLVDTGICTSEELSLCCNLMGKNTDTLEQICYVCTGEHLWQQEDLINQICSKN